MADETNTPTRDTKRCHTCNTEQPRQHFPPGKNRCRKCAAAAQRRSAAKNAKRSTPTLFPEAPIRCPQCQLTKPADNFSISRASSNGRHGWCKPCAIKKSQQYRASLDPATRRARNAQNTERARKRNPEWARKYIGRKYGLSHADITTMTAAQKNRCAICKDDLKPGRGTNIDHCHKTGRVRKILCHACNKAIGFARDSPEILIRMAAYLEQHSLQTDSPPCETRTATTDAARPGVNDNGAKIITTNVQTNQAGNCQEPGELDEEAPERGLA